jgi:hypothetical protein
MRLNVAIVLLAAGVIGGCLHGKSNDEGGRRDSAAQPESVRSGEISVVQRGGRLGVPHVVGNRVYGLPGGRGSEKLASRINTTFVANVAPAAAPDPRVRTLAYNAFHRKRPVVRVYDLGRNEDTILDVGAYSIAWRGDGGLAYFKGLERRIRNPRRYPGHVVVRDSLQARPTRWTRRPGRYVVAAWAGRRVVGYRLRAGGFPHLLVLDRPGRSRILARASVLVALSPDGRQAFVAPHGASPPLVRILNVADGSEVSRFSFGAPEARRLGAAGVSFVGESGSWVRGVVIAPVTNGVAVFRVSGGKVGLEQMLRFDPELFPVGPAQPTADASGRTFGVAAELAPRPRQAIPLAAVLECDRLALRCVQGRRASSIPGPRVVFNPSRP